MSFGKEIRKKLTGDIIEENPLEIIGLSYHILDLLDEGLTIEELYQVVRKNARNILAAVHPDRRGEDNSASRRFSEALSLINNRHVFDNALKKLRQEKGWERYDKRLLKKKADEAVSRLKEEKAKKQQLEEEVVIQRKIAENGSRYLKDMSLHLPSFTPIAKKALVKALYLDIVFASPCTLSDGDYQIAISQIKKSYHEAKKGSRRKTLPEKERDNIIKKVKEKRLNSILLSDLLNAGLESEIEPSISWNEKIFFESIGLSKMSEAKSKKKGKKKTISFSDIKKSYYEKAINALVKALPDMWVNDITLTPVELQIEGGMIKQDDHYFQVVGSIDISALADNLIATEHGIYISNPLRAGISPYLKKNKLIVVSIIEKQRSKKRKELSDLFYRPQYIFLE